MNNKSENGKFGERDWPDHNDGMKLKDYMIVYSQIECALGINYNYLTIRLFSLFKYIEIFIKSYLKSSSISNNAGINVSFISELLSNWRNCE